MAIDPTGRSRGALRFAHWLRDASSRTDAPRNLWVTTTSAVNAGQALDVDGVILGRAAPARGRSIFPLGRPARQALRSPRRPVIVVPPDMRTADFGHGPILVAVQPDHAAVTTARFACRLAACLQLDVELVHMVEPVPGHVPVASTGTLEVARRVGAAWHELDVWVERHGMSELARRVEVGDVVGGLSAAAEIANASLLICGARPRSWAARVFRPSVGRQLAARARGAVAVVPTPS